MSALFEAQTTKERVLRLRECAETSSRIQVCTVFFEKNNRYVLLGHNRNRFMVERPFYWCTKPTPTKLFIPLNYIEWSV
jgi:hypothetical protein